MNMKSHKEERSNLIEAIVCSVFMVLFFSCESDTRKFERPFFDFVDSVDCMPVYTENGVLIDTATLYISNSSVDNFFSFKLVYGDTDVIKALPLTHLFIGKSGEQIFLAKESASRNFWHNRLEYDLLLDFSDSVRSQHWLTHTVGHLWYSEVIMPDADSDFSILVTSEVDDLQWFKLFFKDTRLKKIVVLDYDSSALYI